MEVNESTANSNEETAHRTRRSDIRGNSQNSLKRKSSLKSFDSSTSHQAGNKIDNKDASFIVIPRDKSVRFSSVDIRDYSLCPGDNPSVSRGIPISLNWDYGEEQSYDITKFEHGRCGLRRTSDELKLPSLQRVQLLKKMGYSRGEIKEQVKEVERAKEKRLSTRRRVEREDSVKEFVRGVQKFFGIIVPKSSQKERENSLCVANTDKCDTCLLELDEATISSSISSKRSELSITEFNGGVPPRLLLQDPGN